MLFTNFLRQILRSGTITIIFPNGKSEQIAATDTPHITIRLMRKRLARQLAVAPSFFIPEGYVTGDLVIEVGDLRELLTVLQSAVGGNVQPTYFDRLRRVTSPIFDWMAGIGDPNTVKKNVQYHYDLSNDFFNLFLDPNMQYSCAYFKSGTETLNQAQIAKMRHIAAKLFLDSSHRVLDIGSGWGGLAFFLNHTYGAQVTGITLSQNQYDYAIKNRASDTINFFLRDYRSETGIYDRIVSVGMLEHVGRHHYDLFFSKIYELLASNGVALVHTIGRRGPPMPINPWIRKRIFPGAYLPSLSQLAAAIERTGLWILDCESLRFHYAETLYHWQKSLQKYKIDIEASRGKQFYRAWEFYLTACELAFRHQGLTVFQVLLSKNPDAVPLTRDFMHEEETRLHGLSASPRAVLREVGP